MSEIDVLIPAYNAESYILDSIRSIREQTVTDTRIVIVDDGSTDRTRDIILDQQKEDARIIYHYQENAGIVSALNAGLALCTAPYIARHDADDFSYPERFTRQLEWMTAHPDCVAVSAQARHIDAEGRPTGSVSTVRMIERADSSAIPAYEPYLLHPLLMVRRDALLAVKGYRKVYNSEDSDLYWRLREIGKLHIIREILGDYRLHPTSLSSASVVNGRQMAVWSQLAALSDQRRAKNEPDIDFSGEASARIRAAREFTEIFFEASRGLSLPEKEWLQSAACAKFLELCYYRPFEPTGNDIKFIQTSAFFEKKLYRDSDYDVFREALISAGIRMAISRRIRDALRIVPSPGRANLLARILFRIAAPQAIRTPLKKIRGRGRRSAA
ncbi:glycosyltransferase [Acetobacter musti]|uniref:Glycosyltransferase n=1 Tax=Acetobacter musti TaxID=864732 RepID=A0ABX0JN27_9PROT|nr:glycosyltransferase family A protein [Acetobacter musti]NHN84207.1 glycosyltransferase [Acetobacter musti]